MLYFTKEGGHMKKIVGIQFKGFGKVYYFDPLDIDFAVGEYAIVETVRGVELGKVITNPFLSKKHTPPGRLSKASLTAILLRRLICVHLPIQEIKQAAIPRPHLFGR